MYIGNIINQTNLVNHKNVEYINYYSDIFDSAIDFNLPTLIIGWRYIKESKQYENLSILDKIIEKNKLFWEFSFEENKTNHIDGVEMFVLNLPIYHFNFKYRYVLIDPIFNQLKTIDDLIIKLSKKYFKTYNYKNQMLYLLGYDNIINGIDLSNFEFFKFNKIDVTNIVKERSCEYVLDINGEIYQKHYKIFPNYPTLRRYIVNMI